MKLEVIAYLTSTINSYERQIKRQLSPTTLTPTYKRVVEDLHDLLDYIVDSKENAQATPSELLELNAKLIEDKRLMSANLARQESVITRLNTKNEDLHEAFYKIYPETETLENQIKVLNAENKVLEDACTTWSTMYDNLQRQLYKVKNTKWDENISC